MDVMAALKARDLPALQRALAEGPAPKGALRQAIYLRFSQGVDALIAAGTKPDAGDAAALGDVATLRALVAKDKAALTAPGDDGFPPLHLAAHFGRVDALRALLNLGAPVDLVGGPPLANTALHAAAAGGQKETTEALLAAGARTDVKDANGYLAVHVAAASGSVPILRALAAKGADMRARGPDGKTPLDLARQREMDEAVAFLEAK